MQEIVLGRGRVYAGVNSWTKRDWPVGMGDVLDAHPGDVVTTYWGEHVIPPARTKKKWCDACDPATVAACRRAVREGRGVACEMVLERELREYSRKGE